MSLMLGMGVGEKVVGSLRMAPAGRTVLLFGGTVNMMIGLKGQLVVVEFIQYFMILLAKWLWLSRRFAIGYGQCLF